MKVDLGGKKEFSNPLDWWRVYQWRVNRCTANAADLIFPLHDSWPIVEVYEDEKDKKRKRLFS